jgi:hypothetical protein
MHARRMVWAMLAVSIYLSLLHADTGPTVPVQAETPVDTTVDGCVAVDPSSGVTVDPDDCVTTALSP